MTPVDDQRRIASLLLAALAGHGFALAGAGAIREHGFTARPTEDVDLFAFSAVNPQDFAEEVARAERELGLHGYVVVRSRSFPLFVRLHVTDAAGADLDVDFGVNWRAHDPELLALGPVLLVRVRSGGRQALGRLLAGRAPRLPRPRRHRRSGRCSDQELLALGQEHDAGFGLGCSRRA